MAGRSDNPKNEFEKAGEGTQDSLVREFIDFVFENKKWWMIPILLTLILIFVVAWLASSPVLAPFIYPLF